MERPAELTTGIVGLGGVLTALLAADDPDPVLVVIIAVLSVLPGIVTALVEARRG